MGIPGGFGEGVFIIKRGLACSFMRDRCHPYCGYGLRHTYVYYMHYSEDTSVIKLTVAAICEYLITNYGNLLSLEYVVWFVCLPFHNYFPLMRQGRSFPVSLVANLFVVTMVQFLSPQGEVDEVGGDCSNHSIDTISTSSFGIWCGLVNSQASAVSRARFYSATPAVSAVVLAEILITTSLCVLLYDSGSRSAVPRTKRLLNTLIIYAVNRCLLTLLVTIAQLVVDANDQSAWTMGLDFIGGKLYANSLLASLNTRQHLRSQGSRPESGVHVNAIHFANLPKLSEDERSSKDRERYFEAREGAVLDITTVPVHDRIPALRGEGEV
ncbi:hypothetical protein EV401DRAFT_1893290 [Pisolithus croceorrhizus]|nr:hypothetical protein EV401DRAFT_1893290 [Pisolithus croceorrhizus]